MAKYTNLDQVIIISAGFFILFTAFIACQNLSSKIMKDLGFDNLGFINLSLVYLSFALTGMLSSPINRKFGTRNTLIISSLTYAIWIAAFLLPAYKYEFKQNGEEINSIFLSDKFITFTTIFTAFLLGIGAGPLWVSQAFHISLCASEENKGLYNGIFFSTFIVSQIATNLIAAQLIQTVRKSTFYWIMAALGFVGSLFFMLIKTPKKLENEENQQLELAKVQPNEEESIKNTETIKLKTN